MKKVLILFFAVFMGLQLSAQKLNVAPQKVATVDIQTNGVCQKCADRFNAIVPNLKGVVSYKYDIKTAKMTIKYNPSVTNPDVLRKAISEIGYNADSVKANPEARAKLPACCRGERQYDHKGLHNCDGHHTMEKATPAIKKQDIKEQPATNQMKRNPISK